MGGPVDYRLITTGPDSEPGINGALCGRRAASGGEDIIAYVNTIQVDDLAATGQRIELAGGERVVEPADIPGVGTVAYFTDTEGNLFASCSRRSVDPAAAPMCVDQLGAESGAR